MYGNLCTYTENTETGTEKSTKSGRSIPFCEKIKFVWLKSAELFAREIAGIAAIAEADVENKGGKRATMVLPVETFICFLYCRSSENLLNCNEMIWRIAERME